MMRFGDVIHTFHEEQLTEDERHFGVDHCHLKKEKKTAYVKKKWAVYLSVGVVVVFEEVIELLEDEEDDAIAAPEEEKDKHKNVVGVIAVVAELEEVVVVVVAADVEFDALYKTKAGVVEEPWKLVDFEVSILFRVNHFLLFEDVSVVYHLMVKIVV